MARTWVARSVVGAVVAVATLTAYRPGWIASVFRQDPVDRGSPDLDGDRAGRHQLEPVPLTTAAHGTDGNGHVAPAPRPEPDDSEQVVT